MKGLLIAVEGLDGSGLTTHSKLLVEALNSRGYRSAYTKEPTEGPIGILIRRFLRGDIPDVRHDLLALLFAADRVWHYYSDPSLPGSAGIEGAISRGYIVVCDRYKYSSLAYQGSFAGLEWVESVNSRAPEADIIVYIDTDIEVNLGRLVERRRRELYENRRSLEKIKELFEAILERRREDGIEIVHVRGSEGGRPRPIDEVSSEILEKVLSSIESLGLPRQ
jgi:dTMP kinase